MVVYGGYSKKFMECPGFDIPIEEMTKQHQGLQQTQHTETVTGDSTNESLPPPPFFFLYSK